MSVLLTAIPSPTIGVIYLGPLKVQIYSICILVGIAVAI